MLQQRALLVHGLYVGTDELHDLSNVVLGYCPAAQAQFDFPAHPTTQTLARLTVARKQHHSQSQTTAELLASVWSVPGQLHPRLPVGAIQAGHRANLVIFDLNHPAMWPGKDPLRSLVYGSCSGAIHGLMVNGQFIGDRGNFAASLLQSEGWREGVAEASERLKHLLARVGS